MLSNVSFVALILIQKNRYDVLGQANNRDKAKAGQHPEQNNVRK